MIACIVMPYSHQLLLPLFSLTWCSGSRQKGASESEFDIDIEGRSIQTMHLNTHSVVIVQICL